MFVPLCFDDIQEFFFCSLDPDLERDRPTIDIHAIAGFVSLVVSFNGSFNNFDLAFQLLIHSVDDIPKEFQRARTGAPKNVGIAFVILEERIDGLPFCPGLDVSMAYEFL